MAEDHRCPHCEAWIVSADDAWCGQCGEPCAGLILSVEPAVLQAGQKAPRIFFRLQNPSCVEQTVERLDTPQWIAPQGDSPRFIAPYGTLLISARASTSDITEPVADTITVVTGNARATAQVMAIEANPQLICSPAELEFWSDGSPQEMQVPVAIEPRVGVLQVLAVRQGTHGGLRVVGGAGRALISPGQPAAVVLESTAERIRFTPSAALAVDYQGPHGTGTVEVAFRLAVKHPPQLRWAGQDNPPEERVQANKQRLRFELFNQDPNGLDGGGGNARLEVLSADLALPAPLKNVPVQLLTTLPIKVKGGDACRLEFDLNLEEVPAESTGLLHLQLKVRTNGPSLDKKVPLLLRPMPHFDGVLAIDFGTSNTCCAIVETGREYERLSLDGTETVAPTVVRYLDLTNEPPKIETGIRVKERAAVSTRVAASMVAGLKQLLGDERQQIPVRPDNMDEWTTRKATAAAADYLRHIRQVAAANKGAVFSDFILTHPAVCSLLQYRNLRDALLAAFGGSAQRVQFLQEPIAALIPLFLERAANPGAPGYVAASFDLGGGTTDIAVVRVEHILQPGGRMDIRPRIVYSRGVRFGGEHLTDFLEKELSAGAERLLARVIPDAALVKQQMAGASLVDELQNRYAFREAAEAFKTAQSEEKRSAEEKRVFLRILRKDASATEEFSRPFEEIRSSGGGDLAVEFKNHTRLRLETIALLLQRGVERAGGIDVIQLSGKTSFLPVVAEVIRNAFPGVEVVRAPAPKECVVAGACLSRAASRGSRQRLVLGSGMHRMTSSIGLYDAASGSFTPVLPLDAEVPAAGLEQELPNSWFGDEPVVLWENLGVDDSELKMTGVAAQPPTKLGTWRPERNEPSAQDEGWALRLTLKDLRLSLTARGPVGEVICFRSPNS